MRRLALTLTLALVLGAGLLPGGVAHAETDTARDTKRDLFAFDTETSDGSVVPKRNGDILRAKVRHNNSAVVVRVKFRGLARKGDYRGDYIPVVTNEIKREVHVGAGPGHWGGDATMTKRNGNNVSCNVGHRIVWAKNLVKVRIPRSCLSKPRWVRVGVGSFWSDGTTTYVDDARLDGEIRNRVKLSGRIRRG